MGANHGEPVGQDADDTGDDQVGALDLLQRRLALRPARWPTCNLIFPTGNEW